MQSSYPAISVDIEMTLVLVGSSGAAGAILHRRNFGEAVENLTGSGEYHWMAGNFLKYGAAEADFASKNPGDVPVDSHQLMALCAPRLTFINYGIPEKGDALWLDRQGSYMAAVAAGPVFRLLGTKDLGISDDYKTVKMPPVNTGLFDGQLAWRAQRRIHGRPELEVLHPRNQGIPDMGGCSEADIHRRARPSGRGRQCPAADRQPGRSNVGFTTGPIRQQIDRFVFIAGQIWRNGKSTRREGRPCIFAFFIVALLYSPLS